MCADLLDSGPSKHSWLAAFKASSCGGKIENLGIRDSQVFLCHGLICDFAPCGTENPEAENPVLSILQSQLLSENGGSRNKVTVSLDRATVVELGPIELRSYEVTKFHLAPAEI